MVRPIFFLIALLLCQNSYALTQVSATIDKNPVRVNESFILEITADDDIDSNALDTRALMQDFIVGNTSVSSQTSMVNFNTTRSTTWTTLLIARKPGEFIIPAFTIAGKQTAPIALIVSKADDSVASKANQEVFISAQVSASEVYVQQQFTLTVQLHFASELKRGSLTEPQLTGATIHQIGKDQESNQVLNGRRFRVIERNYAVNPQQSGKLTLTPPIFSGEVMANSARRSMFLSFADSKPVSVATDNIDINIKPIPAGVQGTWLPSELLTLTDEWQPNKQEFKVGEPITRTISLTAVGLAEEQLPTITVSLPDALKIYPDQAQNHTSINQGQLVSQTVQNFAIVASKPGSYTLPEVSIAWWNTVTNRAQTATLPATTVTIMPAELSQVNSANTKITTSPANELTSIASQPVIVTKHSVLQWVFLALWLSTCLAWLMTTLSAGKKTISKDSVDPINYDYLALLKACKQDNGAQVLNMLLAWGNSLSLCAQPLNTLDELVKQVNDANFTNAVHELQQCYFAKETKVWQGNALLACIQQIGKTPQSRNTGGFQLNP